MSRPAESKKPLQKVVLPRTVAGVLGLAAFAWAWFGIAGRATWWRGWAFLLTFIIYVSVLMWRVSKLDPELVRERNVPADKAEAWDRVVMGIYSVLLVVLLIVCALDGGRHAWSAVPLGVQMIGWLLLVVAGAMVWHVMMINAYLSSWARIQDDRGQVVVQQGMYRYIRHPMYLGVIAGFLGIPLVLGSWWGMVPSVAIVGLFVYRTYREDRMLMEGLAGYAKYTEEVRYRLLPGIW
jgi:protein-S-isoprenylcysteine O-methyltransferase Ste14